MTAKRFTIIYGVDENPFEWDLMDNEKDALICQSNGKPICDLLNGLHEENQQIKDLIHTMLRQIDVENITSDSAIYSAKIIFSRNEFNLIRELWKR